MISNLLTKLELVKNKKCTIFDRNQYKSLSFRVEHGEQADITENIT